MKKKRILLTALLCVVLAGTAIYAVWFNSPSTGDNEQTPRKGDSQTHEEKPQEDPQPEPQPEPQENPQPEPQENPQPEPQEDPKPEPPETPQPEPQDDPQPKPLEGTKNRRVFAIPGELNKQYNPTHPRLPADQEYVLPVYPGDDRIKRMYQCPMGFTEDNRILSPHLGGSKNLAAKYPCNITGEVESLRRMMNDAKSLAEPHFPFKKGSRGIIFSVPMRNSPIVFTSVDLLLHQFNISYPIELWVDNDGFTEKQKEYLKQNEDRITVKNLNGVMEKVIQIFGEPRKNEERYYNFIFKVASLFATEFDEVIMIDSDAIPFRDLTEIFEHPLFKKHGAMFWFDRSFIPSQSDIWTILGILPLRTETQDSCMVALRKSDCWRTLYTTMYMNVNQRFFYTYLYGDKDTFLFSFILNDQDYVFVPGLSGIGGQSNDKKEFWGEISVLGDPEGRLLFLHAVTYKAGRRFNNTFKLVHCIDNVHYRWAYTKRCCEHFPTGQNIGVFPGYIEYRVEELTQLSLSYVDSVYEKMLSMKEESSPSK